MNFFKIENLEETITADDYDYSVGEILTSTEFKHGLFFYFYSYSFPQTADEYSAEAFHSAFTFWKDGRLPAFQKIYDALNTEYKPLENYDRYEQWTEGTELHKGSKETFTESGTNTQTGSDTLTRSGNVTETHSGEQTETHGGQETETRNLKTEDSANNSNQIYGFNSGDAANSDTSSASGSTAETGTVTTADGKTITTADGRIITTADGRTETTTHNTQNPTSSQGERHYADESSTIFDHNDLSHEGHLHGNIGVTTSQEMLTAELKLRNVQFLKKYVIEDFAENILSLEESL